MRKLEHAQTLRLRPSARLRDISPEPGMSDLGLLFSQRPKAQSRAQQTEKKTQPSGKDRDSLVDTGLCRVQWFTLLPLNSSGSPPLSSGKDRIWT